MRQHAIADQDAEAAGIEERLMHAGDVVDHAGKADGVVGPAPLLALERQSRRQRAVDVGKIPRLDAAVGPAGASKHAELFADLLLQIDADPGPAVVDPPRGNVGRHAGRCRKRDGIGEMPGAAAAQITRHFDRAVLAPELVAVLDFADELELLERGIEVAAVRAVAPGRRRREIEYAAAYRPVALVPLGCRAVGEAPAVAGV